MKCQVYFVFIFATMVLLQFLLVENPVKILLVLCLLLLQVYRHKKEQVLLALELGSNKKLTLVLILILFQMYRHPGRGNARRVKHNQKFIGKDVYSSLCSFPILFYRTTRHTKEEFDELVSVLEPFVELPRNIYGEFSDDENQLRRQKRTKLTVENRILMALMWMAGYPTYSLLAFIFGVDKGVVSLELHHIIPIICATFSEEIKWPTPVERRRLWNTFPGFRYCIAAIDGTVHRRNRPGHKQSSYYRKDVGYHFVTSQMVVNSQGHILDFETGFPGHQQDQGNWHYSILGRNPKRFFSYNESLLGDGIYHGPYFVTPFNRLEAQRHRSFVEWSRLQRRNRQCVEWAFGFLKRFASVVIRFRHTLPFQTQTIIAAALLSQRQLKRTVL